MEEIGSEQGGVGNEHGGDESSDKCTDEDIPTTLLPPSLQYEDDAAVNLKSNEVRIGPMTRARAKLLKQQVNLFLSDTLIDENFILPKSYYLYKTLLDTTCSGSFTSNKEEFKRDLLDRIKENAEDWENDKGKESGYADKPPFKPLPPKEGNEEKEEKKKKKEKKKERRRRRRRRIKRKSFQGSREEDDILRSRRMKGLSLGMPRWFIPAYFKKTQASKLGDAQGIPFFIDNLSGKLAAVLGGPTLSTRIEAPVDIKEPSIAQGGEEQLDKKLDVKLDMELDMKTSHGRAREEQEACARGGDVQAGAQENKNSADIITWREYEALRNEMRREFRTQDDELRGTVQDISQKLDATNETQHEEAEDPDLQDEAPGVGRGAGRGYRGRGFAELGRHGRGLDEEDRLGKPKFSIPKFEGGTDVEEYLTWEVKIEKLWRLHNYTEDRKIKFASSNLMAMHCVGGIDLFVLEKRMLTLLRQGVKTVDEYFMEMEMLMQRGRVRESLEMTMQRFLHGLKYDIKGIVRYHSYTTMNGLLHHAREAEAQLAEVAQIKGRATGAGRFTPRAPPPAPTPSTRFAPYYTPSSKPVSNVPNTKKSESAASTSGSSMSTECNRDMNCHTCGGKGHFKRDCPNRKVMFVNEDNEYETGDDVDPYAPEDDDYDTDGVDAYPSDARTIVVSQRALNVLPSAPTQCCNLFHTKALVGPDKACKVIIDGGSCRNLASKELCTKLKLKYLPHSHPYYIQWLSDNGEMKVNHMVRVEFEIGPYKDSIDFDVVPMMVCHLLLGWPWLYDRSVQHNGRANTYHLEFKGKKINLQPMSPQQIVNESRQKVEVNLEDASIDRRENCNVVSDITKSERVNDTSPTYR
ncbi:hypothetical protein QYE76_031624 [Lolium multiflorum]|uniref:CCHC-type domain-containing protein n=1 Tax=Lolium multiflorum TaxID=4521 RepID=A0AAD8QS51_LOLMU|nr:hypothetical protein QYE76_031624 [Lolium multiflorum]